LVITELKQELDKKDQLIFDMKITMEKIKDKLQNQASYKFRFSGGSDLKSSCKEEFGEHLKK